jgi:hypothetical protein
MPRTASDMKNMVVELISSHAYADKKQTVADAKWIVFWCDLNKGAAPTNPNAPHAKNANTPPPLSIQYGSNVMDTSQQNHVNKDDISLFSPNT